MSRHTIQIFLDHRLTTSHHLDTPTTCEQLYLVSVYDAQIDCFMYMVTVNKLQVNVVELLRGHFTILRDSQLIGVWLAVWLVLGLLHFTELHSVNLKAA